MLSFYTDALLTRPAAVYTPKQFIVPEEGGARATRLYLGDAYTATVEVPMALTDTELFLDQTTEFLASGNAWIVVNGVSVTQIAYTSKTDKSLRGVTGLVDVVPVGYYVRPDVAYVFSGDILIGSSCADTDVAINLKRTDQSAFGFRGTPAIFLTNVITTPIAVDVQLSVSPGQSQVFSNAELICGGFVRRPFSDQSAVLLTEQQMTVTAPLVISRRDQGLPQWLRLLPVDRQVNQDLPGFVVGQYRWRDDNLRNALPLVPANWNLDLSKIGDSKFIAGIGTGTDLEPVSVEEYENSVFPRINDGFYFTGLNRYFLPAGMMLEFLNSDVLSHTLLQSPRAQSSVFVGTWKLSDLGFYEKDTTYRYVGHNFQPEVMDLQFTLDRKRAALTLNQPMAPVTVNVGTVSGDAIDYFDMPVYPVANVRQVYIDRGLGLPALYAKAFTLNKNEGTLNVPNIAGSLIGQGVYAVCDPAIAVLYEQGGSWKPDTPIALDTAIIDDGIIYRCVASGITGQQIPSLIATLDQETQDNTVTWNCEGPQGTRRIPADLNPAFSGISGGFVYLQQSRQKATSVVLGVDKPRIAVPPVGNVPIGLIAFGPVYANDYALLIATVYGGNQNPVSNILLTVVPGTDFKGFINYQDPTQAEIQVRTGGDGTANLIFTPARGSGLYLPTTSLATTYQANDTLILPTPVDFTQLFNPVEQWLTSIYSITSDIGIYGKSGANVAIGEIPFTQSGTPGTADYRCNGRKTLWKSDSGAAMQPIEARDAVGVKNTDANFSNMATRLVFASALPSLPSTAAFFVTYVERVTFSLAVAGSNLKSNSVMLQITPSLDQDNPWLILDDTVNGKLDSFRLGWSHQFDTTPGTALVGA